MIYEFARGDHKFDLRLGRAGVELLHLRVTGLRDRLRGVLFTAAHDGARLEFVVAAPWNGKLFRVRSEGIDVATARRFRKGPLGVANYTIQAAGREFLLEATDEQGTDFRLSEGGAACGGWGIGAFSDVRDWHSELDVPDGLDLRVVAFLAFLIGDGRRRLEIARPSRRGQ